MMIEINIGIVTAAILSLSAIVYSGKTSGADAAVKIQQGKP